VYKAEGKEKFRKRSMATARQALKDLCEECGLAMLAADRDLTREDFEMEIELGFL
jgi:hypothetical protein